MQNAALLYGEAGNVEERPILIQFLVDSEKTSAQLHTYCM